MFVNVTNVEKVKITKETDAQYFLDMFVCFQNWKPDPKHLPLVYRLCGGRDEYIKIKKAIQSHYLYIKDQYPMLVFKEAKGLPVEDKTITTAISKVKLSIEVNDGVHIR